MGYDERQQPNSTGTLVAVVGVGLVLAILGIVVVAAAGLFWVRARTGQAQAVATEQLAVAELRRAGVMARVQLEEATVPAAPDPRLNFVLELDREGNTSVDGERIGRDELRAQLSKLKDETSNVFSVHVDADPECPIKHVIPVLDVCDEVGDIDVRIVSSKNSDVPADDRDKEN